MRNITDVDDKINARAAERGIAIRELTEETYENFKQDVAALGCLPPTVEPRATEHIAEMRTLIERLVASGNAYVAEEHVLFSVPSMPDYGKLARRSLDEMMAGARVEVAPYKRDPMDFVLWKPSKPGEPAWDSPGGIKTPGRPGWHIECSAMSWKHLGETFDIHGGGIDLVFPHHENEIAQSRCAFHAPVMANYWMHNGFLQVEGEKMSKSLGNFFTDPRGAGRMAGRGDPACDAADALSPADQLDRRGPDRGEAHARSLVSAHGKRASPACCAPTLSTRWPTISTRRRRSRHFTSCAAKPRRASAGARRVPQGERAADGLAAARCRANGQRGGRASLAIDRRAVESLIAARNAARKAKNFKESDRIRDELDAMGIELEDQEGRHHHVEGEAMKRPDTPFPRHWLYYIVLKIVVIAGAVALGPVATYGYWTGQGGVNWRANASICSTRRCATARRPTASTSRSPTSSRSPRLLDELGIDYVEGGYPGANLTDTELFAEDRKLKTATFTAFGMTRRPGPLGLERSGPGRAARRQGGRHLLRRQILGLPRARRARDHATRRTSPRSATA